MVRIVEYSTVVVSNLLSEQQASSIIFNTSRYFFPTDYEYSSSAALPGFGKAELGYDILRTTKVSTIKHSRPNLEVGMLHHGIRDICALEVVEHLGNSKRSR